MLHPDAARDKIDQGPAEGPVPHGSVLAAGGARHEGLPQQWTGVPRIDMTVQAYSLRHEHGQA